MSNLSSDLAFVIEDASRRVTKLFPLLCSVANTGDVAITSSTHLAFLEMLTCSKWTTSLETTPWRALNSLEALDLPKIFLSQSTLNRYRHLGLQWLDVILAGQWPKENPTPAMMLLALGVSMIDEHMSRLSKYVSHDSVYSILNLN